jgi:hypothetical protein
VKPKSLKPASSARIKMMFGRTTVAAAPTKEYTCKTMIDIIIIIIDMLF